MKGKKKKRYKAHKPIYYECEKLWNEVVKLRAGWKCELSGIFKAQGIVLAGHHAFGKSTYALRFDTRGGICLENYRHHIGGVHSKDPSVASVYHQKIMDRLKQREGDNIEIILLSLKRDTSADLQLIKIKLKQELKEVKGQNLTGDNQKW